MRHPIERSLSRFKSGTSSKASFKLNEEVRHSLARLLSLVRDIRRKRRDEARSRARRQEFDEQEQEKARALEKSAVYISMHVRRALSLESGCNVQQLEYIRLALGIKSDMTSKAYNSLVTASLKAGLIELLAKSLNLFLSRREAVSALKASYIACNLVADSPLAAAEVLKLSPLFIAHLGFARGSALCTQCAWTLSNLATLSTEAASILISQGAIPSLLDVLDEVGRTPEDPSVAYAGATCAWALCNLVRCSEGSKAANCLLSCTQPPVDSVLARLLTRGFIDPDLCIETIWLLVHTLEQLGTASLTMACRLPVVEALCWCLEAIATESRGSVTRHLKALHELWVNQAKGALEELLQVDTVCENATEMSCQQPDDPQDSELDFSGSEDHHNLNEMVTSSPKHPAIELQSGAPKWGLPMHSSPCKLAKSASNSSELPPLSVRTCFQASMNTSSQSTTSEARDLMDTTHSHFHPAPSGNTPVDTTAPSPRSSVRYCIPPLQPSSL